MTAKDEDVECMTKILLCYFDKVESVVVRKIVKDWQNHQDTLRGAEAIQFIRESISKTILLNTIYRSLSDSSVD
jgi:hypothetical protein